MSIGWRRRLRRLRRRAEVASRSLPPRAVLVRRRAHVLIGVLTLVCLVGSRLLDTKAQGPPPASRPPLILISLDGFRSDYLDRLAVPTLKRLAREGVSGAMRPAFPSLTFPNHYTLVTGLHPQEHGITANSIEDPTGGNQPLTMNSETPPWWTWVGEPIWVTAERHGPKTATMFWPASTAEIHGYRPTYSHAFDRAFPYAQRVDQVLAWLDLPEAQRPRFITLYFEGTDRAGHDGGPFSEPLRAAAVEIDAMLARLLRGLEDRGLSEGVNLIVTADHGMSALSTDRIVYLSDVLELESVSTASGGPYMLVASSDRSIQALLARLRRLRHVRAYTWDRVPAHLHFRHPPERARFDVLLLADDGWRVLRDRPSRTAPPANTGTPLLGTHGYDVAYSSMKAMFLAHGPNFARGRRIREFDSARVHALLLTLLGIEPARPADLRSLWRCLVPNGQYSLRWFGRVIRPPRVRGAERNQL